MIITIGRDVETERVIQILNRRQKNNPCLIGEPGVGKTAIAEGLAQRIASGNVPYKLRDKEVFLLDLTALVAGTQFRGQFESRMKRPGIIMLSGRTLNVKFTVSSIHPAVLAEFAKAPAIMNIHAISMMSFAPAPMQKESILCLKALPLDTAIAYMQAVMKAIVIGILPKSSAFIGYPFLTFPSPLHRGHF